MERRLAKLETVYRRHPPRPEPPLLDLRALSVDERIALYDLIDRERTAAEELRFRGLWARVRVDDTNGGEAA